jgi:hypothetical protein
MRARVCVCVLCVLCVIYGSANHSPYSPPRVHLITRTARRLCQLKRSDERSDGGHVRWQHEPQHGATGCSQHDHAGACVSSMENIYSSIMYIYICTQPHHTDSAQTGGMTSPGLVADGSRLGSPGVAALLASTSSLSSPGLSALLQGNLPLSNDIASPRLALLQSTAESMREEEQKKDDDEQVRQSVCVCVCVCVYD